MKALGMTHGKYEPLDVMKLIAAVRGSKAAQVLFEYRDWRAVNLAHDTPDLGASIQFTSGGDHAHERPVEAVRTR